MKIVTLTKEQLPCLVLADNCSCGQWFGLLGDKFSPPFLTGR
ncbi:hypothetical protein T03_17941 [Trichinella britovi]|uniref:Uncharacterized protein n=1 Tax=Trichinella britovi TaxID=45882 RepID=A0A0V1AL26_TRIBR|nr:hypothetical protein T03_17941 [Trichinella britovi]